MADIKDSANSNMRIIAVTECAIKVTILPDAVKTEKIGSIANFIDLSEFFTLNKSISQNHSNLGRAINCYGKLQNVEFVT